jgi:hypothetical protein
MSTPELLSTTGGILRSRACEQNALKKKIRPGIDRVEHLEETFRAPSRSRVPTLISFSRSQTKVADSHDRPVILKHGYIEPRRLEAEIVKFNRPSSFNIIE